MSLTLFFLFLLVAFFVAYQIGKHKANLLIKAGATMLSYPHQYGWLCVLISLIPLFIVLLFRGIAYIFNIEILSSATIFAVCFAAICIFIFIALFFVRANVNARDTLENFIKLVLFISSLISILATIAIILSVLLESLRFFKMESFWYFITGTQWSSGNAFLESIGEVSDGTSSKFGSVPLFAGTLLISGVAMAIAIPIGVLIAIFTSQYASKKTRSRLKPCIEILAGIPTIVYGFFAAITLSPLIVKISEYFGASASFNNALSPGIVMGIMIIPIISSFTDDAMSSIPKNIKHGSLALGTTMTETIWHIMLPASIPGILSATLLGVSRALGETMIVVMAAGYRPNLTFNPLEDVTTVTVMITASLTGDQVFDSSETLAAFALGLMLFFITFILNTISIKLSQSVKERYKN